MCPGGTVVAATSEPGRVVTNGMSQYSRNERNANAGIVVGINPEPDFPGGPLAGVELQEALESRPSSWAAATTARRDNWSAISCAAYGSTQLGEVTPSYTAGRATGRSGAAHCRPMPSTPFARRCRRSASRSAASIATMPCSPASRPAPRRRCASRAMRSRLQSLNVRGLYPCGEGAGYAGGILSAGVDGIKVAEAVGAEPRMKFEDIKKLHQKKFREELGYFLVEGEHLVQELQKAAARDARLRASEIYLTRDYAHWSSPLPMHVVKSRQMAQISETRSPQGIAAVVPLLAAAAPRAGRTRRLSARDPGSRQSRHDPAHAGVVREFPLPAEPRQRRRAQRQGGARQHGRHLPRAGGNRCAAGVAACALRRIACLDLQGEPVAVTGVPRFRLLRVRQ